MKMRMTEGLIGEFGTRNHALLNKIGQVEDGYLANSCYSAEDITIVFYPELV